MKEQHALVLGASGVSGWAIVNQILEGYPSPTTFGSVTALANRPLSLEKAQWSHSGKLQLVTGIDILAQDDYQLTNELQSRVKGIKEVTHMYYNAYSLDADPKAERVIN
ncbi:hypothetical protein ARSEF1564_010327, partial [Beauveria bassiana]